MPRILITYPAIVTAIALMALFGTVVALTHVCSWLLLLPTAVALAALSFRRVRRKPEWSRFTAIVTLIICIQPVLFCFYAAWRTSQLGADSRPIQMSDLMIVKGTVLSCEAQKFDAMRVVLDAGAVLYPKRQPLSCKLRLYCAQSVSVLDPQSSVCGSVAKRLEPGCAVSAQITVPRMNGNRFPDSFRSYTCKQFWLEPNELGGSLANSWVRVGTGIDAVASPLRTFIVEAHSRNIGTADGTLLSSMVLGDKAVKLDHDLIAMFRNVGLSHVLAASGFNLTVVIAMTYFIARFFLRSTFFINTTCFLAMFGYVCLAGASASVMRAAVMCSVFLLIKATRLRPHVLSILGLALTMTILFDPSSVIDVGLQLSYAATVGIVLMAKPLCTQFSKNRKGIFKWFAETVAVVLSSQAAVLPIQLFDFWQIGLMFVPANLAVTPVLAPVTVLGFASSVLIAICYYVPPLSPILSLIALAIDWLSLVPLQMMRWAVAFLASFDWAVLRLGTPSSLALTCYILAWLALVFCLNLRYKRPLAALVYCFALALMLWRPPLPDTTVVRFPHCTLVVDRNREAVVVPSTSRNRKIERYAAQHGWHLQQITSAGTAR